jgi:hypothetical protein
MANKYKNIFSVLLSMILCFSAYGKDDRRINTPTCLTTDLLEHTDRVFLDGYPSTISLNELETTIERYQLAVIHNPKPYLGWIVNSDQPNTLQTAYHILVASSKELLTYDEVDMWDSGRTESDNSVAVPYNGKPLKPSTIYYWKVKTYDNHGIESEFSQIRSFITATQLDNETARYPLQVSDEYPVIIKPLENNHYFVDFGKASFGRLKLTLSSAVENDTVIVHLGESVRDGLIDRNPGENIRYAQYRLPLMSGTHTYTIKIRPDKRNTNIKKTGAIPILMPDYTGEVYPFRYCEIETPPLWGGVGAVVRQTVHYPFNETTSSFHSSDTVLNQIWELCKYSIKVTSVTGTYIDGDRERIPYEMEALISQICQYHLDREFSIARHSHEYLMNHPTWPTDWVIQSVLIAWYDYMYTGNPGSLQKCYNDLKYKSLIGLRESNGLISTRTGKQTPQFLQSIHVDEKGITDIVDWPQTGSILGLEKNELGETDGFVFTDYNAVVNAYHYRALCLLAQLADAIDKPQDRVEFVRLAQQLKKDFNRWFLDEKKGYYKDGIDTEHSSLHANMYPLAFGLVSVKNRPKVREFIRQRGMACSVNGALTLMEALYDHNEAEYGLKLLASTNERSWYNMIRAGSTVSIEAWDKKYKPNLDWNQSAGATPAFIIPRRLMGIEPIEPGFRKIRIKPQPAMLRQAAIKIPSIRGDIHVAFDNRPCEKFTLEVEIPANTTAEVWLPKLSAKYSLKADHVPQKGMVDGDFVKVMTGSGKHIFVIENKLNVLSNN